MQRVRQELGQDDHGEQHDVAKLGTLELEELQGARGPRSLRGQPHPVVPVGEVQRCVAALLVLAVQEEADEHGFDVPLLAAMELVSGDVPHQVKCRETVEWGVSNHALLVDVSAAQSVPTK